MSPLAEGLFSYETQVGRMPQGNIVPRFARPAFLPSKEGGQEGRGRKPVGCPRHCCRLALARLYLKRKENYLAPKIAVPMRTIVEPHSIAVS